MAIRSADYFIGKAKLGRKLWLTMYTRWCKRFTKIDTNTCVHEVLMKLFCLLTGVTSDLCINRSTLQALVKEKDACCPRLREKVRATTKMLKNNFRSPANHRPFVFKRRKSSPIDMDDLGLFSFARWKFGESFN